VSALHHLHIWSLGAGEIAMTAHLVRADIGDHDAFIDRLNDGLDERFGINHPTVQIEHGTTCDHDCNDRAPHGHAYAHGHPHADGHAHAGDGASRHP
jgi:cobalt-zinc-cadmium efflux system protein